MNKQAKIYIAGHRGLVGGAIKQKLEQMQYTNLVCRTSGELDLRNQRAVETFFQQEKPEYIFLAAAKVGGILTNHTYPAEFIYNNLMIQSNIIDAAHRHGVKKLLFLGSNCIYPKYAPQPLREEYLLTGTLEPTNEPYAVAKIAGIKLCQAYHRQYGTGFISVMPPNLYGPHDHFDEERGHVLPALLGKFHEAKVQQRPTVTVWGSGTPKREFLHVDDLADACIYLMQHYHDSEIVNIGSGQELTIAELAQLIKEVVGYQGEIIFDPSKPDGTPRKLLDITKLTDLGWQAKIPLREGIASTYQWYIEQN